jgi:arylsulfatase A-like enzyme
MKRSAPLPWPFLALGVAGAATFGFGLWKTLGGGQNTPVPAPADAGNPSAASPTAVAARGSGLFETPAPSASGATDGEAICSGCDVVVVTVCSLRRDHTHPWREGGSLMPAMDRLTEGAWAMNSAWSASNFTLASLTALLTGRFGSATGVTGWDKGLVADVPTLPEVLGYYGYRTGAFTTDAPSGFRPDYGLDRGFQRMEILAPPRGTPDGRASQAGSGTPGETAAPAAAWITSQPKEAPLFVMFHTRSAHYPFVIEDDPTDKTGVSTLLFNADRVAASSGAAMPGIAGGTAQRGVVNVADSDPVAAGVRAAGAEGVAVWRKRYEEAVARTDADFAVLGAALEARGRLDRTVLIVVADHGESLDDHGELLHGDAYYDGVVHIPMLVRVPGLPGKAHDALVSQVDVLPTVLEAVGAAPPAGINGTSMLPLFKGTAESVRSTTLIEGGVTWRGEGAPRGAVIAPPWALLKQDPGCGSVSPRPPGEPGTCLFNLLDDPGQDRNLAALHPDIVADLAARWEKFRVANGAEARTLQLDPAYIEELHKNGYKF